MSSASQSLLKDIRACRLCKDLPLGPKPLLQADPRARILIVGQAPGRITHERAIAFDDVSGQRLRAWLGVTRETFYDPSKFAIVPMGFCFPGSGKTGDLPPRPECAAQWRAPVLAMMPAIELTIILGRYALDYHKPEGKKKSVTAHVLDWKTDLPEALALPHPSPRNNRWLAKNPWFESDVLPALRKRVCDVLGND